MRIAIVNDLGLAVESLRRSIGDIPGATIAWIAENGARAVARCAEDLPDLILMDMLMPVMDGVEATRRIMRTTPCPILIVTATVEGNASKVFEALGAGALDAVATPGLTPGGGVANAEALVRKVQSIALLKGVHLDAAALSRLPTPLAAPASGRARGLAPSLIIGASTGGPDALAMLLRALPRPTPWPTVIVQHIDKQFAPGLADWLSSATGQPVAPATTDAEPAPGKIFLASTNDHIILDPAGTLRYTPEPRTMLFRPSVDVFFASALAARARPGVAVLLTGMGRDGAVGLASLRAAGWFTIAQDEATSVVWGMPGAAAQLNAASMILPIEAIGRAVSSHMPGTDTARKGTTE